MSQYIHFTEEQKQQAKQADLVSFLQSRGEQVKRSGSEFEWVGHHITLRGNRWYHQYEERGGTAVDFVQEQYNLPYPDAVSLLLGANIQTAPVTVYDKPKQAFSLPEPNENMRRVFAYLMKQRFIDRDVIYHFAHNKALYEDANYHNAVFVGVDKDGVPRHAHKKSTSINDSSFRGNQTGSDVAFSFRHIGSDDTVYVFEAPIDMLSFISMYQKNWKQHSYVTLCSVADRALFQALADNSSLRNVVLCLDNDETGQFATERITNKLTAQGYSAAVLLSQNKDWNEDLKAINGIAPIPADQTETEEIPQWEMSQV